MIIRGFGINVKKCLDEGVIPPMALYGADSVRIAERWKVNLFEKFVRSVTNE